MSKTTSNAKAPAKANPPTAGERARVAAWAQRELAQQSLRDYVRQAWHVIEPFTEFKGNWHIDAVCDHLEAVSRGQIENLLINVPPGTSKSTLVCVMWPTWEWTWSPGLRQMFASYSENYAFRDSIKSRRIVDSEWYQRNWGGEAEEEWGRLLPPGFKPVLFQPDQNKVGKWENLHGGWRMATSVGGSTGEHPDRIGIDDPHKVNEAESEAERQAVVDWNDLVLSSRGLMRSVRRVGVMQRLHAKDWAGHVLDQGGWVHLCLPMRYEAPVRVDMGAEAGRLKPRMEPTPLGWQDPRKADGELLWPDVYTEAVVTKLEAKLGQYGAAGQLQQRPAPRGGGSFKRAWFKVLLACPELVRKVRYWDKAGTAGGKGAQSAGVLMASYANPQATSSAFRVKYVVLDVVAGRWAAPDREAVIAQTCATDRARWGYVETWVEQEPGSGGKESAEATVMNLAGFTCKVERVTGSKEVRAEPLASQASVGAVDVLPGDWTEEFLVEMEMFPMGKRKDKVDAAGGAFNKLFSPSGAFGTAEGVFHGQSRLEDKSEQTENFRPGRLGKEDW